MLIAHAMDRTGIDGGDTSVRPGGNKPSGEKGTAAEIADTAVTASWHDFGCGG